MTATEPLLLGLDVGSESTRAVLARAADERSDGLEILAVGHAASAGVRGGEIVKVEDATECIRHAVEEVEQSAGVEVNGAWVAVGGQHRRSINATGAISLLESSRPISADDVRRAVRQAIPPPGAAWIGRSHALLHALPQEFWVDDLDATSDPVGWSGSRIQAFVHLVAAPRIGLDNLERAVNGAGVRAEKFVLSSLALGAAVFDDDERDGDALVLDVGAMTTDIAVFRRGALWHSDVMPSGGRAYSRDVSLGLQTTFREADRAKKRFGRALVETTPDELVDIRLTGAKQPVASPRRQLAEVLQARGESDFGKIRETLRETLSGRVPGHVVLAGGGASLEGLPELVGLVFGAGTRVEARGARRLAGQRDLVEHSQFAVAVGLCRHGLAERRLRARMSRVDPIGAAVRKAARRVWSAARRLRKIV